MWDEAPTSWSGPSTWAAWMSRCSIAEKGLPEKYNMYLYIYIYIYINVYIYIYIYICDYLYIYDYLYIDISVSIQCEYIFNDVYACTSDVWICLKIGNLIQGPIYVLLFWLGNHWKSLEHENPHPYPLHGHVLRENLPEWINSMIVPVCTSYPRGFPSHVWFTRAVAACWPEICSTHIWWLETWFGWLKARWWWVLKRTRCFIEFHTFLCFQWISMALLFASEFLRFTSRRFTGGEGGPESPRRSLRALWRVEDGHLGAEVRNMNLALGILWRYIMTSYVIYPPDRFFGDVPFLWGTRDFRLWGDWLANILFNISWWNSLF